MEHFVPIARAVPPRRGAGTVSRIRLESLARRLLEVPVALVTGAGGYGKTTLLLLWLEALSSRARTAWLTLAPEDISLSGLVEGIILACSRAFSDFGTVARTLLAQREVDYRAYATALANELYLAVEECSEHVILFIDDAHALLDDADSLGFMSAFTTALPDSVHIVLASRVPLSFAPLSKHRNAGRLLEVDQEALRFRTDEAAYLVDDFQTAQMLVDRTEGWPIAVHLAARLGSEHGMSTGTVTSDAREAVFSFLAEEVVSQLEPDLRALLGPLAVPATLDATIVAHVLERDDGNSILARLSAQSLYITRTDDGSWRLHQLFREFLLKRLKIESPARELEARRRYAELLRERGDKLGALEQLIEGRDLAEIVEYVKDAVVTMRFTDRYRRLLELLSQVPSDVKERKPVLYRFQAIALQRAGRWEDADKALRLCYAAAHANGDDGVACIALLERGIGAGTFRFRLHGDHNESMWCFREALALAEKPSLRERPIHRKLAYEVLGLVHALRFEYTEAQRFLSEAERLELAERSHTELLFVEIARVHMWLGDFRRALEYAELAEAYFRTDAPFHVGYALIVQAKALVELGEDRARAVEICGEAIESLHSSYEDEELGAGYETLASALLAIDRPDFEAALDACRKAEQFLEPGNNAVRADVHLLRARVLALRGDADGCDSAIRRAARSAAGDRWLETRVALEQAACGQTLLGREAEPEPFERCAATFETISDKYHLAVAHLRSADAHIRRGDFSVEDAQKLIHRLMGTPYAVAYDRAISRNALHWCLRSNVDAQAASALYERVAISDDPELHAIARDSTVTLAARVASLRVLVKHVGPMTRVLLRELNSDEQPAIAAVASALMAEMPHESVVPLRIDVVPELRVSFDHDEIREGDPRWGRKKAAELLRLLAVSGAPLSRNAVLQALWPDAYTGRDVTLRVVMHSLRRALQPDNKDASDYVLYDGSTVTLHRSSIDSIDVETALSSLQNGKHCASIGEFEKAEKLLEEAVAVLALVPKESSTPLWLHPHVQRWRTAALDGFRTLASIYRSQRRQDASLTAIRRALALDTLDEATVVVALECFTEARLFDEGQALYATYKRRLADTLGTVPGAEALERYARLLASRNEKNRHALSSREIEIVNFIADGKASKDIASALGLSVYTVNNHVGRILKKLGVDSRAAAVAYVQREQVLK